MSRLAVLRRAAGIAGAVAVIVCLTALTYRLVDTRVQERQEAMADQAAGAVALMFAEIESDLLTAQVEIGGSNDVPRAKFNGYAAPLVAEGRLRTFAYAPLVGRSQRTRWEESSGIRIVDLDGPGAFVSAATRPSHAPVQFVYPGDAVTRRVIGFDVLGDPVRGPEVRDALADGRPHATAPSGLASTGQPGMVIFQPLMTGPPGERNASAVISSFIGGNQLDEQVRAMFPASTEIAVGQGQNMLAGQFSPGSSVRSIEVLDQQLTVSVVARPSIEPVLPAAAVAAIASLALVAALLVSRARRRDRDLARERQANAVILRRVAERLSMASTSQEVVDAITEYLDRRTGAPSAVRVIVSSGSHVNHEVTSRGDQAVPTGHPTESTVTPLPGGETMTLDVWLLAPRDAVPADIVRAIASMAGLALRRALDFDRQREDLDALQQSLLPKDLPTVPGVAVEALYVPSSSRDIGGDWYDVHALDDDSVLLIIGDVVGRGLTAAATMGQLRVACDVASEGSNASVDAVLRRLNAYCMRTTATYTATCLAIRIASDGIATAASAGHIDPLLVTGAGASRLSVPTGPALGLVDEPSYPVAELSVREGEGLLLLTDGMIERRSEPVDASFARAVEALDCLDPSKVLRQLPDVLQASRDDDAAALLYLRLAT